jgi:hypothetical protein
MLNCKKCKGRLFVDRVYSQNLRIEVSCLMCGKRWFIKKDTRFGAWLTAKEEKLQKNLNGIFT